MSVNGIEVARDKSITAAVDKDKFPISVLVCPVSLQSYINIIKLRHPQHEAKDALRHMPSLNKIDDGFEDLQLDLPRSGNLNGKKTKLFFQKEMLELFLAYVKGFSEEKESEKLPEEEKSKRLRIKLTELETKKFIALKKTQYYDRLCREELKKAGKSNLIDETKPLCFQFEKLMPPSQLKVAHERIFAKMEEEIQLLETSAAAKAEISNEVSTQMTLFLPILERLQGLSSLSSVQELTKALLKLEGFSPELLSQLCYRYPQEVFGVQKASLGVLTTDKFPEVFALTLGKTSSTICADVEMALIKVVGVGDSVTIRDTFGIITYAIPGSVFCTATTHSEGGIQVLSLRASNQLLRSLMEYTPVAAPTEKDRFARQYPLLMVYGISLLNADGTFIADNLKLAITKAQAEEAAARDSLQRAREVFEDFANNDLKLLKIGYLINAHLLKDTDTEESLAEIPAGQPIPTFDITMATVFYRDLALVLSGSTPIQDCPVLLHSIVWCGDAELTMMLKALLAEKVGKKVLDELLQLYSTNDELANFAQAYQEADAEYQHVKLSEEEKTVRQDLKEKLIRWEINRNIETIKAEARLKIEEEKKLAMEKPEDEIAVILQRIEHIKREADIAIASEKARDPNQEAIAKTYREIYERWQEALARVLKAEERRIAQEITDNIAAIETEAKIKIQEAEKLFPEKTEEEVTFILQRIHNIKKGAAIAIAEEKSRDPKNEALLRYAEVFVEEEHAIAREALKAALIEKRLLTEISSRLDKSLCHLHWQKTLTENIQRLGLGKEEAERRSALIKISEDKRKELFTARNYPLSTDVLRQVGRNSCAAVREFDLLYHVTKDEDKTVKRELEQVFKDLDRNLNVNGQVTRGLFSQSLSMVEREAKLKALLGTQRLVETLALGYSQGPTNLFSLLAVTFMPWNEKFPGVKIYSFEALSSSGFVFVRDPQTLNFATIASGFAFTFQGSNNKDATVIIPGECFVTAKTHAEGGFDILSVDASNSLLKSLLAYTPLRSQGNPTDILIYPPLTVYGIEIIDELGQFHEESLRAAIVQAQKEEEIAQLTLDLVTRQFEAYCEDQAEPQKSALKSITSLVQAHSKSNSRVYGKSLVNEKNAITLDAAMVRAIYRDLPAVLSGEKQIEDCPLLLKTIIWCGVPELTISFKSILIPAVGEEKLQELLLIYGAGDGLADMAQAYQDSQGVEKEEARENWEALAVAHRQGLENANNLKDEAIRKRIAKESEKNIERIYKNAKKELKEKYAHISNTESEIETLNEQIEVLQDLSRTFYLKRTELEAERKSAIWGVTPNVGVAIVLAVFAFATVGLGLLLINAMRNNRKNEEERAKASFVENATEVMRDSDIVLQEVNFDNFEEKLQVKTQNNRESIKYCSKDKEEAQTECHRICNSTNALLEEEEKRDIPAEACLEKRRMAATEKAVSMAKAKISSAAVVEEKEADIAAQANPCVHLGAETEACGAENNLNTPSQPENRNERPVAKEQDAAGTSTYSLDEEMDFYDREIEEQLRQNIAAHAELIRAIGAYPTMPVEKTEPVIIAASSNPFSLYGHPRSSDSDTEDVWNKKSLQVGFTCGRED